MLHFLLYIQTKNYTCSSINKANILSNQNIDDISDNSYNELYGITSAEVCNRWSDLCNESLNCYIKLIGHTHNKFISFTQLVDS